MFERWEVKRALMVVKTYPTPAWKGGEVVCTAGITEQGQWIRLFPVPYRLLENDQQFKKYQWIEARVIRATSDVRPESYQVDAGSIRVLGEPLDWAERLKYIRPLVAPSLCSLHRELDQYGKPTLGIFRPKMIKRLHVKPTSADWEPKELARLNQLKLIESGPIQQLQKIPHSFSYDFDCTDSACRGHSMLCTDWEMAQSYRSWLRTYGPDWEGKFRQRYFADMTMRKDTHFFVGTVHGHPRNWVIVGLCYPPKVGRAVAKAAQDALL